MTRPELAGNVIQQSLGNMGLLPKAKRFQVFWMWNKIVGPIAKNAKPRRLDGDTLYVATCSSTWAQELTLMRRKIISMINEDLGGNYIKEIRFSEHLWGITGSFCTMDFYGSPNREYKQFMSQDVLSQAEMDRIKSLVSKEQYSQLSFTFQRFAATMEKRKKYLVNKGFKKCSVCGFFYRPDGKCPYCWSKEQKRNYNTIITILEKHPETSDLTISVSTGIKEKDICERARQELASRWYRTLVHGYFEAASRRLTKHDHKQLQSTMLKLVSLRTGKPGCEITARDVTKVLGKRLSVFLS